MLNLTVPHSLQCIYHIKYCINIDHHELPIKIRVQNEDGLCNECFVLKNGCQPTKLIGYQAQGGSDSSKKVPLLTLEFSNINLLDFELAHSRQSPLAARIPFKP